jgi:hypothetical protein
MRTASLLALSLALGLGASAIRVDAQTRPAAAPATAAADSAAIRNTALDYIEGWYTGDADRMRRALHPDMAKRVMHVDTAGRHWLYGSTAELLIRQTGAGFGTDIPAERRWRSLEILDIDGNLASVKLSSTKLVDYMHMARWDGGWRIVNVLWDSRPEDRPRP